MVSGNIKESPAPKKLKKESLAFSVFLRFIKNKSALAGVIVFLILMLLSLLSPYITPYQYQKIDASARFVFPNAQHWFGTDQLGRDIFTRILYGGRYSLSIGFIAIGVSFVVGVIIGAFCGYLGGKLDLIFMRIMDILQSIPPMLMTITIAAALGHGFEKTIMALSISRIPGFARMMRSTVMKVRTSEYLEAAEAIGCSKLHRIFKYAVPNAIAPTIVELTLGIAGTVLMLSSLSYIGLGIRPPIPEWGAMLSEGMNYFRSYPYMILFPGLFIAIAVLSLNLAGDGLRDALDPRLKQ